jgi:hypothetical protein
MCIKFYEKYFYFLIVRLQNGKQAAFNHRCGGFFNLSLGRYPNKK